MKNCNCSHFYVDGPVSESSGCKDQNKQSDFKVGCGGHEKDKIRPTHTSYYMKWVHLFVNYLKKGVNLQIYQRI